jgi:hypothetical protein
MQNVRALLDMLVSMQELQNAECARPAKRVPGHACEHAGVDAQGLQNAECVLAEHVSGHASEHPPQNVFLDMLLPCTAECIFGHASEHAGVARCRKRAHRRMHASGHVSSKVYNAFNTKPLSLSSIIFPTHIDYPTNNRPCLINYSTPSSFQLQLSPLSIPNAPSMKPTWKHHSTSSALTPIWPTHSSMPLMQTTTSSTLNGWSANVPYLETPFSAPMSP